MSGRYKTLYTYHDFPDAERWLRRQAVKYSKSNAKQKRIALEQFDAFLYMDGYGSLDAVDNLAMEEFSVWLDDTANLAHGTISHRWYAVRQYLNDHIDPEIGWLEREDEWILKWLDKGTKTARERDLEIHWLPQDSIYKLIDGAAQHPKTPLRNKLVVELLWNTGCRPSEIARMKKRRMDRGDRMITVRNSKVSNTNAENYEKDVFYSRKTRKTMREWLDRGGRAALPYADDSPFLIVGYNTPSISARQVNSIVRQAADAAGIQEDMIETASGVDVNRVTPKALRHSFAVHSVRGRELSGSPPMNLETLRRIMGHASLDTTRQYLQFRKSSTRSAFDQTFPG